MVTELIAETSAATAANVQAQVLAPPGIGRDVQFGLSHHLSHDLADRGANALFVDHTT